MSSEQKDNTEYLGDGLYVSFDGYQLSLKANGDGVNSLPTDTVYIEQSVWNNLVEYVKRVTNGAGE
jgi:hypothetical protein